MYRSPPETGPSCDLHPAAAARAVCTSCKARICVPCSLYDGLSTLCPACAKRARRGARARHLGGRALIALALVGVYLATAHAIAQRRKQPPRWGDATPVIRGLIAAHDHDPCDTSLLTKLLTQLRDSGDVFGAIDYLDRSQNSCALPDEIDVLAYELHRRAHDLAGAARDLRRRIERDPLNADLYTLRAYANLGDGEPQAAVEDLVAALHCPSVDRARVVSDLRQIYSQMGREDVARTLGYVNVYAHLSCGAAPEASAAKLAREKLTGELKKFLPPELDELRSPAFVSSLCAERTAAD